MGVYLSPVQGLKMVNWTYLDGNIPKSGPLWQGDRETFFIFFNYGHESVDEFQFSARLYAHDAIPQSTWLDIALVSHHLFHTDLRTESFQTFIDSFPKWIYSGLSWMSTYESWKF